MTNIKEILTKNVKDLTPDEVQALETERVRLVEELNKTKLGTKTITPCLILTTKSCPDETYVGIIISRPHLGVSAGEALTVEEAQSLIEGLLRFVVSTQLQDQLTQVCDKQEKTKQ